MRELILVKSNLCPTTTHGTQNLWPLLTHGRCSEATLCYKNWKLDTKMVLLGGGR